MSFLKLHFHSKALLSLAKQSNLNRRFTQHLALNCSFTTLLFDDITGQKYNFSRRSFFLQIGNIISQIQGLQKRVQGQKNRSEIRSDILYHKFQETVRKSKGMIAIYSSNSRSIPELCLPLILLSFKGGNGEVPWKRRRYPRSAHSNPVSAGKKLHTKG